MCLILQGGRKSTQSSEITMPTRRLICIGVAFTNALPGGNPKQATNARTTIPNAFQQASSYRLASRAAFNRELPNALNSQRPDQPVTCPIFNEVWPSTNGTNQVAKEPWNPRTMTEDLTLKCPIVSVAPTVSAANTTNPCTERSSTSTSSVIL